MRLTICEQDNVAIQRLLFSLPVKKTAVCTRVPAEILVVGYLGQELCMKREKGFCASVRYLYNLVLNAFVMEIVEDRK